MACVGAPLPLEDTLGDSGDGGVVPGLDMLEKLGEALVVVLQLRWPVGDSMGIGVVSI